jgi:hypothetical protein
VQHDTIEDEGADRSTFLFSGSPNFLGFLDRTPDQESSAFFRHNLDDIT